MFKSLPEMKRLWTLNFWAFYFFEHVVKEWYVDTDANFNLSPATFWQSLFQVFAVVIIVREQSTFPFYDCKV